MLTDELRIRSESGGGNMVSPIEGREANKHGRILLVDPRIDSAKRIVSCLSGVHNVTHVTQLPAALEAAQDTVNPFELVIVSFDSEYYDGLRLCSQMKTQEATRQTPILIIVDADDNASLLRALDMGVNDYLMRPVDREELVARVHTQIRRWRYTEQLRQSVHASIALAITDPLTGLYNRRYLETHLSNMIEHYVNRGKALSVAAIDVDYFKAVNDTHGHDTGDKVLQELAVRLRDNTRSVDLCCRTGGEEFIVVLPNTASDVAQLIAERLRKAVASRSFAVSGRQLLPVTVSVGLAMLEGADDSLERLLKRADMALYKAKREGRNRVTIAA